MFACVYVHDSGGNGVLSIKQNCAITSHLPNISATPIFIDNFLRPPPVFLFAVHHAKGTIRMNSTLCADVYLPFCIMPRTGNVDCSVAIEGRIRQCLVPGPVTFALRLPSSPLVVWAVSGTASVTGHHPQSTVHRPPSIVHAVRRPRSTVHCSSSTVHRPRRPPSAVRRPPSAVRGLPSTVHRPQSTVHRPPSTVHRLPSTVHRPPSTVHRPPSTVHRLPSSIHRSLSTVHRLPPTVSCPSSSVHCLPSNVHRAVTMTGSRCQGTASVFLTVSRPSLCA